jgi:hypothetical protein
MRWKNKGPSSWPRFESVSRFRPLLPNKELLLSRKDELIRCAGQQAGRAAEFQIR